MQNTESRIFQEILFELQKISHEIRMLRFDFNENKQSQNDLNFEKDKQSKESKESKEINDEYQEKSSDSILTWLATKNIEVIAHQQPDEADHIYDELTLFLGDNFGNLSNLYEKIKQSLSNGETFTLNLGSCSQQEIADITKFARMLVDYAFLISKFKDDNPYNREARILKAAPQREGKVINFFTGGWFERYVFLKISSLLKANGLGYSYLRNPKIRLANADQFELDLLFMVEDQPVWLECKTGDYQSHIKKYTEFNKKHLKIDKERSFLVVLDINDRLSDNLTALHDITVANIDNFLQKVSESIGLSKKTNSNELSLETVSPSNNNSLTTLLNRAGLRPLPQLRKVIIEALIQETKDLITTEQLSELKDKVAARLINYEISKSKVQDIFNAIVRSGCFLDEDGETIPSFSLPVKELVSDDPEVIEDKCIESYARTILNQDIHFFENQDNIQHFQEVVGGRTPSLEVIENLCQAGNNNLD